MKIISTTDAIINESWLKFISWNLKLCAVIFVTIVHCECDFCGCSVEARPDGLTVGMWCTPPGRVPLSSILQNWLKLSISFYFCAYANFYPILLFVKAIWKCPPSSVLLCVGFEWPSRAPVCRDCRRFDAFLSWAWRFRQTTRRTCFRKPEQSNLNQFELCDDKL